MKKRKIFDGIIVFLCAVIINLFVAPFIAPKLGIWGTAVAEILFVAAAFFAVRIRKEHIRDRFNLGMPTIGNFFAAAVLILGANAWQNAVSYIYMIFEPSGNTTDIGFMKQLIESDISPMVVMVCVALIPALCEELLFRGFLLDSFRGKHRQVWAVIVSALMFSLMHFDLYKAGPTFILGLTYGYIAAVTGSVLLPILFHFINNSMAIITLYQTLGQTGGAESEAPALVFNSQTYVWMAVATFGVGCVFVYFGCRLFSGGPSRRGVTLFVILLAVLCVVVSTVGIVFSACDEVYSKNYYDSLRRDTRFTDRFTVDHDAIGIIHVSVYVPEDVEAVFEVTNAEGDTVYEYSNIAPSGMIELPKGEYTVTYEFDIEDGSTTAINVGAMAEIITVGGYESAEQTE